MRLKSLRLFGFKTFAEQTTLSFEPGITALVGPNGSGKSNLVDAIRWVLGEQSPKSLRTGKTEDVIFAGNDRRKPLGMAEVALTFDNEDGALKMDASEVQITRRAYRAGESEFFINRQQVRLRDIIDLLMGTGLGPGSYSIVSQGQVDAILSSKPSERRSLFEETSGISKFLARKAESLRRLEQTEANGIRVNDLLTEIQARIPELETQARRARRFRRASARLRDLEILSYLRASTSRRAERERLQVDLERLEVERAGAGARAAALEAELSTLRGSLLEIERRLDGLRAESMSTRAELSELGAQRAALGARREALEGQSSQITGDRSRAEAEQVALRSTLERLEAEILPRSAALEAQRERERTAQEALSTARAALDLIFTALREVEASAASYAASEAERRAQLHATQTEYERLEREAFALREEAGAKSEFAAARTRELEEHALSPLAVRSYETRGRERPEDECLVRTPFQRDRDRILHSKPFRRLKGKTQVFIDPAGDHYRTRMTHTLETTGIARVVARALRLNEDLTEAIGLGHDLGHPPFGHAGEAALDALLDDGFRHNEQSAKIARRLNLTHEVVDGILTQKLNWGLILVGAFFAIVLEIIGIPSLPVAVGSYLPISTSATMFLGGVIRWLVERKTGVSAEDADSGPGVLFSSGLIAGGAITGVLLAVMTVKHWDHYDVSDALGAVAQNPIVALAAFVLFLGIPLYRVGTKKSSD